MTSIEQKELIKKLRELDEDAKKAGIPNISQPGMIKELILADHLDLIVNPKKHDHDAVSQCNTIKYEFMTAMESVLAYDQPDGNSKFIKNSFQVDRVSDTEAVKTRLSDVNKVIAGIFLYEDPLVLLRIYEIDLTDDKHRDEFVEAFSIGESNHANLTENDIINLKRSSSNISLEYDYFADICKNQIENNHGSFAYSYGRVYDDCGNFKYPNKQETYSGNIFCEHKSSECDKGTFYLFGISIDNTNIEAKLIRENQDVDLNNICQKLTKREVKKILQDQKNHT